MGNIIMAKLLQIYDKLLSHFGPQKWWPMNNEFFPKEWEVCVGAVLTQNTNWANVEKALDGLSSGECRDINSLIKTDQERLEDLIRPSGFFQEKAKKLKSLAAEARKHGSAEKFLMGVSREELLDIRGIGPETADSILLYACNRPFFVVDAYTKRIFSRLGMVTEKTDYDGLRNFFESNLPEDNRLEIYKEFHALIVKLAKEHCRKTPDCVDCPLRQQCRHAKSLQ